MSNDFYILSEAPRVTLLTRLKTFFLSRTKWFTRHIPRHQVTHREVIEYALVATFLDWWEYSGKHAVNSVIATLRDVPEDELVLRLKALSNAHSWFSRERYVKNRALFYTAQTSATIAQLAGRLDSAGGDSKDPNKLRDEICAIDTLHLKTIVDSRTIMGQFYRY